MAKAADRRVGSGHLLQLSSTAGFHQVKIGRAKRADFSFFPLQSLFLMLHSSPQGPSFEHLDVTFCIMTYSKVRQMMLDPVLLMGKQEVKKNLEVHGLT